MAAVAAAARRFQAWAYMLASNAAHDYRTSLGGMAQGFAQAPERTTAQLLGLGGLGYLVHRCPHEDSFHDAMSRNNGKLLLCGAGMRNPEAVEHFQRVIAAHSQGRLEYWDLLLATVVVEEEEPLELRLFSRTEAVPWFDRMRGKRTRVIDLGFNGRWLFMEDAMVDYDIGGDGSW